ncbi:MAG: galactose mutarotase [Bacteroidales bacterium]|nr:galactose mutarotase [Bacteroidales bacterium]
MKKLEVYTLQAGRVQADITNLGARVMRLMVGGVDVVQGFDRPEDYLPENHLSDFGAVIGRYANRLAGGRIAIDWDVIQLPQNDGPNCLHGGPRGWQYAVYDVVEASDTRLELAMVSPDGDQGFPGTVQVRVVYSLSPDGALRIDYHAETDQPTVINITNHSYFNLSGDLSSSIHDHLLLIDAERFTPVNRYSIPLGKHASVEGTPFDFRRPKPIGRDIEAEDPQLLIGRGYDHNYVLRQPSLDHVSARLTCPQSGIVLEVSTTAPGLQLYTGNYLGGISGKGGVCYPVRSAVCLETQQYPDSPNRRWPESTGRLLPDHPFHSTTVFKFSI